MSETPVVDLHSWRTARGRDAAAELLVAAGTSELPPADHDDASALTPAEAAATVIQLPVPVARPAATGMRSVFGPVMAFGLKPREGAARSAAVGGDDPAPVPGRPRAVRPRHLWDARGATRGPGR